MNDVYNSKLPCWEGYCELKQSQYTIFHSILCLITVITVSLTIPNKNMSTSRGREKECPTVQPPTEKKRAVKYRWSEEEEEGDRETPLFSLSSFLSWDTTNRAPVMPKTICPLWTPKLLLQPNTSTECWVWTNYAFENLTNNLILSAKFLVFLLFCTDIFSHLTNLR